jgi:hypothetical protein
MLLFRSPTEWHYMCILVIIGPIWHRIVRNTVIHQLQLNQSVIIFNDFVSDFDL